MSSAVQQVRIPTQRDLYYGGAWHKPRGGYTDTYNPANGESLGPCAEANAEDVDAAVARVVEAPAPLAAVASPAIAPVAKPTLVGLPTVNRSTSLSIPTSHWRLTAKPAILYTSRLLQKSSLETARSRVLRLASASTGTRRSARSGSISPRSC